MELFWLHFFVVAVGTTPRYVNNINHQVFRSVNSVSLFVVDLRINQKTQPKLHEKKTIALVLGSAFRMLKNLVNVSHGFPLEHLKSTP